MLTQSFTYMPKLMIRKMRLLLSQSIHLCPGLKGFSFFLSSIFIYEPILMKISMNAIIKNNVKPQLTSSKRWRGFPTFIFPDVMTTLTYVLILDNFYPCFIILDIFFKCRLKIVDKMIKNHFQAFNWKKLGCTRSWRR